MLSDRFPRFYLGEYSRLGDVLLIYVCTCHVVSRSYDLNPEYERIRVRNNRTPLCKSTSHHGRSTLLDALGKPLAIDRERERPIERVPIFGGGLDYCARLALFNQYPRYQQPLLCSHCPFPSLFSTSVNRTSYGRIVHLEREGCGVTGTFTLERAAESKGTSTCEKFPYNVTLNSS